MQTCAPLNRNVFRLYTNLSNGACTFEEKGRKFVLHLMMDFAYTLTKVQIEYSFIIV